MKTLITIYHGSSQIVDTPTFGSGRKNNDFGLGFYCTESNDLAKEWAVSSLRDGFSNRYTLDTEYLKILNLNSPNYTILNWIAVLVEHRLFTIKTPIARRSKHYLIEHFGINVNASEDEKNAALVFVKWMTEMSGFSYNEDGLPIVAGSDETKLDFKDVTFVQDEPAVAGEEDLLNELNMESELNINNGGNTKIQEIIEHASNGDMEFDEIMAQWNALWSDAQDSCGVEVNEE